jgi:hypothetical protein
MATKLYGGSKGYGAVRIGAFASLIDTEIITIGNKVYEWDNNAAVTAGRKLVTIGASDAACATNLAAAINAEPPTQHAVVAYVDPVDTKLVRIETVGAADVGLMTFTTTMAHVSNTIAAVANKLAGAESQRNRVEDDGEYIVTAQDILAGNIMIPTKLQTPRRARFQCYTTDGDLKVITWRKTISTTRIKITANGATAPIQGDVIVWNASE